MASVGRWRLAAQFAVSLFVIVTGLYLYVDIDGHLVVPLVPSKNSLSLPAKVSYLFH